jgi:hypothetical protein
MTHPALQVLQSDDFLVRFGVTSNARAMHAALRRSDEVENVRDALYQGQIDEQTLRDFVSGLLESFRVGELLPFDVTLAAVAVAVESRPTPFVDEFLSELSRLQRREFPIAIRVAQECRRVHSQLTGDVTRIGHMQLDDGTPAGWEQAHTFVEEDCQEQRADFVYEA